MVSSKRRGENGGLAPGARSAPSEHSPRSAEHPRRPAEWHRLGLLGAGMLLAFPLGLGGAVPGHPAAQLPWGAGLLAASQLPDLPPPAASLGATGSLPRNAKPSPGLVRDIRHPGRLALPGLLGPAPGAAPGQPTGGPGLPVGRLGIPGIVLDAYLRAERIMAAQQPGCHLRWWMLAGIGQVESGQADDGLVDQHGTTLVPILGPVLNGANGTAAVAAGASGQVWARAVGPMQFIPSSWQIWGGGGNPNNVYDAALAAARYLCAGGRNLSVPEQLVAAIFSYNHSDSYVRLVLSWAYAYSQGVTSLARSDLYPVAGRRGRGGSRHSSGGKTATAQSSSGGQPRRSPAPSRSSAAPSQSPSSQPPTQPASPSPSATSPSPPASPSPSPAPSPTGTSPSPSPTGTSPSPSPTGTSPSPSSSSASASTAPAASTASPSATAS